MMELCPHLHSIAKNVSVHSLEAAIKAQSIGANAVTFGPIFHTPSKKQYGAPQGLAQLEKVIKALSIPIYAIGGITSHNMESCLQRGAVGVMMQRFITSIVRRKVCR